MELKSALAALNALSHEHRLGAVRQLIQAGPDGMPVGALREALAIPPATLTAHLNLLRAAGLVRDQREGRVIRRFADYAQMYALLGSLTENCCAGTPGECRPEACA